MQNFQDTFEIHKRSFISAFSICMTVPLRDRRKISLLILSEFRRINLVLFPLKMSENLWFSDDFRGEQKLINSLKFT